MHTWWRKGRRRRVATVATVLVLGTGGAGAWMLTRPGDPAAAATSTATVATETVRETVAVSGSLAPARSADLSLAVSGTVTEVLVEPGDVVRKGQALVRVDDTALVASRRAALATYDAAVAQLAEDEDAGEDDTRLAADQTAVVAAQDSLDAARTAVDDATLVATQRGTVTAVGYEVGDVAGSSGGSTAPGGSSSTTTTTTDTTAAVSIVSTGTFVLDATVAAADVGQLKAGLQAEITASGVTDTVYGTVGEVGRVAETSASGAAVFPVEITVTGTRDDLYSGTTADATVIVSQTPDVLTVSTGALQSDGGTTYVDKVVDAATGATERTEVEIGEAYGATTQVVSGLAAGDVVEVQGFTRGPGGGTEGGQQGEMPEGFTPPDGGMPGGGFPGAPS